MSRHNFKHWLKDMLGELYLLAHPSSPPLPLSRLTRLHVVLGTQCNCRCKMCYQEDYSSKLDPVLFETALRPLFPHLRELILQGGEPTLMPETRRFAQLVLRENPDVRFSLFTNGQRFGGDWASFFLDHGSYVNFSINATRESTYRRITSGDVDWDRLMENIRRLVFARAAQKSSLRIQTSFVVTEDNLPELCDFLEFSRALGADEVHYFFDLSQFPRDLGQAGTELARANEWRQANPGIKVEGLEMFSHHLLGTPPIPLICRWPFDSLYVTVNGDALFCCLIHKPLGNLKKAGAAKLWNGWRARRLRRMIRKGNLLFCGPYCRPRKRSCLEKTVIGSYHYSMVRECLNQSEHAESLAVPVESRRFPVWRWNKFSQ